jgi:hypothetical protein
MEVSDRIYLIAAFPNIASLERAITMLSWPADRLAVLAGNNREAQSFASLHNISTSLNHAIQVSSDQQARLDWYRANDPRPLLAVMTFAADGRDLRYRLNELGGELIDTPNAAEQIGDAALDPSMVTARPDLPGHDKLAFNPREG